MTRHDYCARCGADAKEVRQLQARCVAYTYHGSHIWTWNEGDSIIPFPDRRELIEAKQMVARKG